MDLMGLILVIVGFVIFCLVVGQFVPYVEFEEDYESAIADEALSYYD